MKIRSTEDLTNYLDDDLAWRRKEIIELRVMAKSAKAKKADVHARAYCSGRVERVLLVSQS